jgi:hypothetical protein
LLTKEHKSLKGESSIFILIAEDNASDAKALQSTLAGALGVVCAFDP